LALTPNPRFNWSKRMDKKNQANAQRVVIPQMQVRSDVRSGGDLETCQYNLEKWKERYYYWYDQAKKAGKV
jgi:hypothetical protein